MANEKRLIDADAFMDVIRQHEYRLATKNGSIDYGMFTLGIQQAVDEQPTIDAVPVVRCRECFYYTPVNDKIGKCVFLIGEHQYVVPDGYCYLGERKEGSD